MLEQISDFVTIGKYILLGVALIGLVLLVIGYYRREKSKINIGVYMLVFALVVWVCAQILFYVTIDRANQKIYDIQEQYGY